MSFGVTVRYDGNHFMDIKVIAAYVKSNLWKNFPEYNIKILEKLKAFERYFSQ